VAEGRSGTVMAAIGGVLVLVFSFCLLFSLIWLLLGGIFAVTFPIVFGLPVRDAQLDEEAVTCPGTLVAVEWTPDFQAGTEGTAMLTYRYDVDQKSYEEEIRVVESSPIAAQPLDSAVTVEYLPGSPGVSRLEGTKHSVAGWGGAAGLGIGGVALLLTIASALPLLLGLWLLFKGLRRRKQHEIQEAAGA